MCGFAGLVDPFNALDDPVAVARSMGHRVRHRGPDDAGDWASTDRRVALSFRRLSIQDLSQHGHQPMLSATGRWVICFNGEVYNFPALRSQLEGRGARFRGGSDTEVILAAVEAWGVRAAVQQMVGMFAMALWDVKEAELSLVRDRFGVKPLYFGCPGMESSIGRGDGGGVLPHPIYFASELKALRAAWGSAPAINRVALQQLLRFQYVPAPWTLWNGIRKLLPSHILRLHVPSGRASLDRYWSAGRALADGARRPHTEGVNELIVELGRQVDRSVRDRIISDVPLGAFLSGGIDSALVVSAMQRASPNRTKTFTIGSYDDSIDESTAAREVAEHLGTEHHSLLVGLEEARDPILRLGELADEPLGDASFIPTFLVSQFARASVSVILSGDGGDEVFAGYPQHRFARRFWPLQSWVPPGLARRLRGALLDPSELRLRGEIGPMTWMTSRIGAQSQQRIVKAIRTLGCRDRARFMTRWRNVVPRPECFLLGPVSEEPRLLEPDFDFQELGPIRAECWADVTSYLPNDVMLKVDRASMAVSLEAREPLLDHRLFEFAAGIPERYMIRHGQGKWILRETLRRSVPSHLVDAPKRGFSLPVAEWVLGPLRDWAESLISEDTLREQGYFHPKMVRSAWEGMLEPGANAVRLPWFGMWSILAFQAWLQTWN